MTRIENGLGRPALILLVIDEATQPAQLASPGELHLEGRTKLTKLVFLAQAEAAEAAREFVAPGLPYEFDRYRFGPFSSDILADLDDLSATRLVDFRTESLDSQGRVVRYLFSLRDEGAAALKLHEATHAGGARLREVVAGYADWDRRA